MEHRHAGDQWRATNETIDAQNCKKTGERSRLGSQWKKMGGESHDGKELPWQTSTTEERRRFFTFG